MWLVKGVVLGLLCFCFFTVAYIRAANPQGFSGGSAMGLSFLASLTLLNPLYWTVLVLMVGTASLAFRMMEFRPVRQ